MLFGEDPFPQGFHRSLPVGRSQAFIIVDQGLLLPVFTQPVLPLIPLLVEPCQAFGSFRTIGLQTQLPHFGFRSTLLPQLLRSEERRVGKECRSRWSSDR